MSATARLHRCLLNKHNAMKKLVLASKNIILTIVFLGILNFSWGQTTIWSEDFSTSSNYSVTLGGEGNDGTSDYFQRTNGSNIGVSYSGNSGDFFAAQDVDDGGWTGSANPSQLTWTGINISGYSSLTFEGLFASAATAKIDAADYVKVEINIDGGGWITILEFENDGATYNTYFLEDTDFDGTGDGTQLTSTFATFTKNISGSGSSMDLRITVSVNAGGEDFAFDEFYVKGTATSCSAPTTQASSITFSSVDHTSMTVNWTNGNGSNRVVKINTSNSFTAPADGTDPSANSTYGGSGEQVVYNGNSNSVSVDGLTPGTTYWFRIYEYNCTGSNTVYITSTATNNPNSQTTVACSTPTTEANSMTFSSVGSSSMTVSWTSGNGESRILVAREGTAITSSPTNSVTYSASTTFGSGDDIGSNEYVVYNGTGNSVTVNGLSASTTYYFKVFEYNCDNGNENYLTTSPLAGSQTTTAVPVPAVLEQGDLAVVGVCSNISSCVSGTSGGDDEISFVCFKDITTGTEIDMTDNGWERCHTGQWGNAEGYWRIKRTGSTITAGTVITIRFHGSGPTFEGIWPDNDWSVPDTGGFARLILNADGDQIYFMQGGTWNDGTSGNNDATYTGGEVLFGFNTNDSWTSGICSTPNSSSGNGRSQNSGLYDSMDCFNMVPSGATDYLKYTGPTTPASQIEWVGRINDNTNWTSFSNCTNYYSTSPDYTNGDTLDITNTGLTTTYKWYGNKDTHWFDCANWGPLRVPTASHDVVIPNSSQVDNDIVLVAGENAECNNFTVQDPSHTIKGENGSTKVLTVNGDLTIDGGSIDFDDGNNTTTDGTIYLKGDWINNNNTTDFAPGNSTVIFNGNTTQTIISNDGTENFGNVQITGSSVLKLNNNDLKVSGNWTNYNQSGLTEGTSTITFNGISNQNINTTGGEIIYNVIIDNPTTVTLSNNLTVSNQLNQSQGELVINGKTLTLQNDLIRTTGTFTGSSSSNLTINGSGNLATELYFTSGSESLNNLTINRSSSGTVTIATNLTVYGQLGMTAGELNINDKILTMNGTISGTGTLKGSANSEIYIGGSGNLGTMYFSTGAQEVKDLTSNRSSGNSTLGTDLTVNTLLTLTNGIITTGTNNLIVSNSSASAVTGYNTNSYVNGNLRRSFASNTDTYGFPVGTSTMYTLAEVVNNNLTGISYIDSKFLTSYSNSGSLDPAKAVDFGTPYNDISPEGIWYLEPDVQPSGGNYNIKLHFDDGGGSNPFSGLSDNKFGPLKRDVSSTSANDWTALNGTLNANGGTGRLVSDGFAQRNGITSFSHFAIGRAEFQLPIELLNFDVLLSDKKATLNWITSAEINNNYFEIQKSKNATSFKPIGKVTGAGNSNINLSYSFTDNYPYKGISYYRLKQVDFDGEFSYSNIVSIENNTTNNNIITFYNNILQIKSANESFKLNIYNSNGQFVLSKYYKTNYAKLDLSYLNQGIYFVKIFTNTNSESKKIVIR